MVFDVCAAPFGTAYFFSCRFAELPARMGILHLVILLGIGFIFLLLVTLVFNVLAIIFLPLIAIAAVYILRNAVALGLQDLDATLMRLPFVSTIYVSLFRRETYYRQDTRLMYCDVVNSVVQAKIEEVTALKGITLVRFNEFNPLLEEIYRRRMVKTEAKAVDAPPIP